MDKIAKEQKQTFHVVLRRSQVKEHLEQARFVSSQRKTLREAHEVLKESLFPSGGNDKRQELTRFV